MSREFNVIEAKKFIIERMNKKKDISLEININNAINKIIDEDEEFLDLMDNSDEYGYSGDDEVNYIINKTEFEYEFIELVLWQKYIYEMSQDLWKYDAEPCINCGSSNLRFREVEGIDFADKVVCEECGCEMIIGEKGLELFRRDRD